MFKRNYSIIATNLPLLLLFVSLGFGLGACQKNKLKKTGLEDHFYMSRAGADMPVWVYGNAEAKTFILTVHGGPILGNGLDFRRGKYSEELEEKYTMVYWDQRHSGASHGSFDKNELSIRDFVEDIALLERLLREKYGDDISIFLMGHSFGGFLTTNYLSTKDYQSKIKGWINVSGLLDSTRENIDIVNRLDHYAEKFIGENEEVDFWKSVQNDIAPLDTSIHPMSAADEKTLIKLLKKVDPMLKKKMHKEIYRQGTFQSSFIGPASSIVLFSNLFTGYAPVAKELDTIKLLDVLPDITIPGLFISGEYDMGTSPDVGKEFYDNVGSDSKKYVNFIYSSHEAMLTEPEGFNNEVIAFIEEHK